MRRIAILHPQLRRSMSSESKLRLPVPKLTDTYAKYIAAAKPLISNPAVLKEAESLWKKYLVTGEAEKQQAFLDNRAKTEINWLQRWWRDVAYLSNNLPLPIHMNPGMIISQSASIKSESELIDRLTRITVRALIYRGMIIRNEIPNDSKNAIEPLCMRQYAEIFDSCRFPGDGDEDIIRRRADRSNSNDLSVVVLHRGTPYKLLLNQSDLLSKNTELQLRSAFQSILKSTSSSSFAYLTSLPRNEWRSIFPQFESINGDFVDAIESAAFVLCIDEATKLDSSSLLRNFNHGIMINSGNRWFDKTLQLIVDKAGCVGVNYEHTVAEGPPIAALSDHLMKDDETCDDSSAKGEVKCKELPINLTPSLNVAIDAARARFHSHISSFDLIVFNFSRFGTEEIKKCRVSPDAFVQTAFQLTFYALHGRAGSTYESASTRRFALGRTDTIRSCSSPLIEFCRSVNDKHEISKQRELLRRTLTNHVELIKDAMNGLAIDRHLLGLKLSAAALQQPPADFFSHESFSRLMHFHLSTSQVSSKSDHTVMGFGAAVPDGYSLCYNIRPSLIKVSIGSNIEDEVSVSSKAFALKLHESFCILLDLLSSEGERKSNL